ncbi:MAG TPA: BON domain-containing protein [Acidimicrobiales bacterium]
MLLRTILLPARLTIGVGKLSAKSGYKAGRASVVGTYRAGRALGYRRMATLALGIGIGLLIAPMSGQELRDQLRRAWEQRRGADPDDVIADRVRHELSHSPRTWHLPQPAVEVVGGRAVLTGSAPHETGKQEIERVAAAVDGVADVDNRLVVGGSGDGR